MPGSSNASFIPKRNTINRERRGAHRQVYVGTILVRIAFIAVLIAVAAIFFYKNSLQKELDAEVVGLSSALDAFNEAELQRVQLIDTKLKTVNKLMSSTVSTKAIMEAVEVSTLGSAQIINFDLKRIDRETLNIGAQFEAPSFDAVLFQKDVFAKNSILTLEKIEEISIEESVAAEEVDSGEISKLGFRASIAIGASDVPHTATEMIEALPTEDVEATDVDAVEGGEEADEAVTSNEEII